MGINTQPLSPKDQNQVIAPKDEQNKVTSNSSNDEQQKSKFSQFFAVGHEWLKNRYDNTYIIKPLINWTVSPKSPKSPKSPDETPIEKNLQNKEDLKLDLKLEKEDPNLNLKLEKEDLKLDLTLDKENPLEDDFVIIEKNETKDFENLIKEMQQVPEEAWVNTAIGKGLSDQKINFKDIVFDTVIIDKKTEEVVENPKKDENTQNIEKNDQYEEHTLSHPLLLDLPRATFVVGDKVLTPQTPHKLTTFLDACKSELNLSPEQITKLSKGFHQGLAGADWVVHMANDLEPKGVMKLAQENLKSSQGNLTYTVNKSNDENILTLTVQDKSSLEVPPYTLTGNDSKCQLIYGVRVSFNIKTGSFTRNGAYAKIDPPLSPETIKNLKNDASQNNIVFNQGTIDGALKNLKFHKTSLSEEQKKMITDEVSRSYAKTFGGDWAQQLIVVAKLQGDIHKIFNRLQTNPLFCIHSMLQDLKLKDTPLNEKQKKAIADEVLTPEDESNNATLTKNLKSQRFRSDTLNKLNQEVLEAFEKFKDDPEFQKLGKDSSPKTPEGVNSKRFFPFLNFFK